MAENISDMKETVDNRYAARSYLGESFTTNKASIEAMLDDNLTKGYTSAIVDSFPSHSLTEKRRDTQVGGNDAINCYYQFNENDDIIHPINKVNSDGTSGLGRVYNETFDQQQQIVYLTFGVPDFTNAANFVKDAYNQDLATLMNTGDVSIMTKIGKFVGWAVGTALTLPYQPIKFLSEKFGDLSSSKYYDLRPTMPLYYKTVNTILAHLASNMNLIPDEEGGSTEGVPNILKNHGLDILTILSRKFFYDNVVQQTGENVEKYLDQLMKDVDYERNIWTRLTDGVKLGVTEAMLYVGFRVEKSSDSSEQASNSTKELDFLGAINSQVSAGREATFNFGALRETGVGSALESVYKAAEGLISGALDSVGIQGGAEIMKGSGFLDVPEIWSGSSFSKSYSFTFQLRTPYGDPVSIFYSLYIPLAMLLAGAFPRSVGQNAYTSPFLVRAYCKGMFAIPLGIIDSIQIQRGASEYGWTDNMLPTQIDVTFTIKDLSPIMHVAIADGGISDWLAIFGQNSAFQEYMLTLSGANIADRVLKLSQFKNRKKALTKILMNNKLNPMMMGFDIMNTKVGRLIIRLNPVSRIPGADNGKINTKPVDIISTMTTTNTQT